MARALEVFLDLETDPDDPRGRITIFGLYSSVTGYVQLVGEEVTPRRVRAALPRHGHVFTFDGDRVDLPIINEQIGIDLTRRFTSRDLRRLCKSGGLVGGQKAIERELGWKRPVPPLNFFQQRGLWRRYERDGDVVARGRLLRYNRHDLEGMRWIRRKLTSF